MQSTDPKVTKRKFQKNVNQFKALRAEWSKRGVFLTNEEFPEVELIFSTAKITPVEIAFAIKVNFINYDTEPPSVQFIDPFTGMVLKMKEVKIPFLQIRTLNQDTNNEANSEFGAPSVSFQQQNLLQAHSVEDPPFFCIKGIREYHQQSAHTGDSWFLYRGSGEGTLHYILEQLYYHSVARIVGRKMQVGFAGYQFKELLDIEGEQQEITY